MKNKTKTSTQTQKLQWSKCRLKPREVGPLESGLANGWQQFLWRTKGPPLRGGVKRQEEEERQTSRRSRCEWTLSSWCDWWTLSCNRWTFLCNYIKMMPTNKTQVMRLLFCKKSLFDLSSKSIKKNSLQCYFWLPPSLVKMKKVPRSQPEASNSWKLLWKSSCGWLVGTFSFWYWTGKGWGAAVKDSLKTDHNLRKNNKKKTFVSKCLNSIQSQILEFVQTH